MAGGGGPLWNTGAGGGNGGSPEGRGPAAAVVTPGAEARPGRYSLGESPAAPPGACPPSGPRGRAGKAAPDAPNEPVRTGGRPSGKGRDGRGGGGRCWPGAVRPEGARAGELSAAIGLGDCAAGEGNGRGKARKARGERDGGGLGSRAGSAGETTATAWPLTTRRAAAAQRTMNVSLRFCRERSSAALRRLFEGDGSEGLGGSMRGLSGSVGRAVGKAGLPAEAPAASAAADAAGARFGRTGARPPAAPGESAACQRAAGGGAANVGTLFRGIGRFVGGCAQNGLGCSTCWPSSCCRIHAAHALCGAQGARLGCQVGRVTKTCDSGERDEKAPMEDRDAARLVFERTVWKLREAVGGLRVEQRGGDCVCRATGGHVGIHESHVQARHLRRHHLRCRGARRERLSSAAGARRLRPRSACISAIQEGDGRMSET